MTAARPARPGASRRAARRCLRGGAGVPASGPRPQRTWLNRAPLRDLRDPATPPPEAADATGRSGQVFLVEAVARRAGRTCRATARGRDIYAFTAPFVCEAVRRLLGSEGRVGATAPGAAFDARRFLQALAPDHLSLEIDAG